MLPRAGARLQPRHRRVGSCFKLVRARLCATINAHRNRTRRLSVMATNDIRSIADWLVDGARSTMQAQQVLAELCDRLVGCGIPLWRVAVFVRTLHPHIMGRRFIWRPGADIEVRDTPFDLLETAEFQGSPVAKVYTTGTPIRRRLADADCPIDFPMLRELQDD